MEIMLRIPDDIARRLGTSFEIECQMLRAWAIEEYAVGRLSIREIQRVLGADTQAAFEKYLSPYTVDDLKKARAQRKGLT